MYGEPLKLPIDLIAPPTNLVQTAPQSYVEQLRKFMTTIVPRITRINQYSSVYVPKDLCDCEFVFIRDDRRGNISLSPVYQGPYKVLKGCDKYFTLQFANKIDDISISRLKPAYLQQDVLDHLVRTSSKDTLRVLPSPINDIVNMRNVEIGNSVDLQRQQSPGGMLTQGGNFKIPLAIKTVKFSNSTTPTAVKT